MSDIEFQTVSAGHYEPSLTMTVLRGCRSCGGKHPLAYDPPHPSDKCPTCGAPTPERLEQFSADNTVITDWRIIAGNFFMRIGAALSRLSGRTGP